LASQVTGRRKPIIEMTFPSRSSSRNLNRAKNYDLPMS
jgi:hypothetical protein